MVALSQKARNRVEFEVSKRVMPGGVGSPARAFASVDVDPIVVAWGEGDEIVDVEGCRYIDYVGSWGAIIHGHAHPVIIKSIQATAALGTSFGLTTRCEAVLASLVQTYMPSCKKVRFVSSGTEATMTAVRLARGFTHRDMIVKFIGGYHGHADLFLTQAGSALAGAAVALSSSGVPANLVKDTLCLPYNDVEAVRAVFNDSDLRERIAAVIVEPVAGNMGVVPGSEEFLQTLRAVTIESGALLIFDEVITGFRVALGGAQAYYKVAADLTCLGKVVSGGTPMAALGGSAEVMDCLAPLGSVYQAGTLSGNPLCMAAGRSALEMLAVGGVYEELERKTRIITEPLARVIKRKDAPACVQRVGSMFTVFWGVRQVRHFEDTKKLSLALFRRCYSHLVSRGILPPPSQYEACFVSTAHTDQHLEKTRDAWIEYVEQSF